MVCDAVVPVWLASVQLLSVVQPAEQYQTS